MILETLYGNTIKKSSELTASYVLCKVGARYLPQQGPEKAYKAQTDGNLGKMTRVPLSSGLPLLTKIGKKRFSCLLAALRVVSDT